MCRNSFSAEIIENISKQEDKFGDWIVACEEDEMMDKTNCKIFSEYAAALPAFLKLYTIEYNPKINNAIAISTIKIVPLLFFLLSFFISNTTLIIFQKNYRIPFLI